MCRLDFNPQATGDRTEPRDCFWAVSGSFSGTSLYPHNQLCEAKLPATSEPPSVLLHFSAFVLSPASLVLMKLT